MIKIEKKINELVRKGCLPLSYFNAKIEYTSNKSISSKYFISRYQQHTFMREGYGKLISKIFIP